MPGHYLGHLSHRHQGQLQEELLHVPVVDLKEILVQLVRKGSGRVQPHRPISRLAKLRTVGAGHQRHGQAKDGGAGPAPDQVDTGGDVAPLVGPADL